MCRASGEAKGRRACRRAEGGGGAVEEEQQAAAVGRACSMQRPCWQPHRAGGNAGSKAVPGERALHAPAAACLWGAALTRVGVAAAQSGASACHCEGLAAVQATLGKAAGECGQAQRGFARAADLSALAIADNGCWGPGACLQFPSCWAMLGRLHIACWSPLRLQGPVQTIHAQRSHATRHHREFSPPCEPCPRFARPPRCAALPAAEQH